ncbi:30S ribosomal protein S17e [Candidatus Woesearchaeota archaeon]|nr:30S ribosomal protein S17e [Candidatus Woesearchaeota archaeon]
MGRIKTKLIKSLTFDLYEKNKGSFAKEFEHNKKIVSQNIEGASKKVRNIIAGYITRLAKKQE